MIEIEKENMDLNGFSVGGGFYCMYIQENTLGNRKMCPFASCLET